MGTSDALRNSIRHTHDNLADLLESARASAEPASGSREDYHRIDVFLASGSKHLHAVDAVLLPAERKGVEDGSHLVHEYLHSARGLEVVLAHVKAHEYGSVYETHYGWSGVWSDVSAALASQREQEEALGDRLTETLDDDELDRLVRRLRDAEVAAPSRPHPYTPHTGLLGLLARRVMHLVDSFWDHVENRIVPEPARRPKKAPGKVRQYFLADPRFDEEQEGPFQG
jgi:hypothetical protein